jgi:DNA-binding NtrC family response regulator
VVDDYTELLEYLANLLESAGHEVELAADGREGLLKFREGGFDAVISDWNMPHLNGSEMISEIIKIDPTVKVVMMSGDYTNQPPERTPKIKMFQKPFHPDALLEEHTGNWQAHETAVSA